MDSDYQAILDQILDSCRIKENWGNTDRQKLKSFRENLGSPTEVAHALEVSVATLYAWEKQESKGNEFRPPPPERQLRKLSRLIAKKHLDSLLTSSATDESKAGLYDVLMRMRSVDEMMKRAGQCDKFWIMRSGRPFVVGNDARSFDLMLNFLAGSTTHYYFVYVEPAKSGQQERRIFRAMESFNAFQKKLADIPKAITSRIHAVPIPATQANEVGLVDPWISFAMAEYSTEGREKYQKSVDVWMEFIFDVSKDQQVEQKQLVWLELPADEAESWRDKRMSLLESSVKKSK